MGRSSWVQWKLSAYTVCVFCSSSCCNNIVSMTNPSFRAFCFICLHCIASLCALFSTFHDPSPFSLEDEMDCKKRILYRVQDLFLLSWIIFNTPAARFDIMLSVWKVKNFSMSSCCISSRRQTIQEWFQSAVVRSSLEVCLAFSQEKIWKEVELYWKWVGPDLQ
jgi:hypothetical protein